MVMVEITFLVEYGSTMQIGDLEIRAGVTARTIRYCEDLRILEPEGRTDGGFRL